MTIKYVITDGRGTWIHKDAVGRFVPTTNIILAERFGNRAKAQNILQSSINKNIRKRYHVEETVENNASPAPGLSIKLEIKPKVKEAKRIAETAVEENHVESWRTDIGTMLNTIHSAEERKNDLFAKLSDIDKEITDIQHYIELSEHLNAYEGWLAYSMLRQRLRQRRKIKDELTILQQLGDSKVSFSDIDKLIQKIDGLSARQYEPRVLKELFA